MGLFTSSVKAPFAGALFDLGGTLVDSDRWCHQAWRSILARRGLRHQDYDPLWHEGMMGVEYVRPVMNYFGIHEDEQAFADEWYQEATALIRERAQLTSGAKRLLKDVRALGVRTAVVTSCSTATARSLLERLGIGGRIDLIISRDVLDATRLRGKPAPDPYSAAAHYLGMTPVHCVAFEDTERGIISARTAGCRSVVGVVNRDGGYSSKKRDEKSRLLNGAGATWTVWSFEGFRIRSYLSSL